MKLRYVIAAILLLIVLTSCELKDDLTQEACTELKHSANHSKVYMDDGYCIVEKPDYTQTYSYTCDSWSQKMNVILKVNETDNIEELFEKEAHWKLKLFCKLRKLK